MTAIKKFCDFCAAFGIFMMGLFLFRKFMPYKTSTTDKTLEKLKHFFSNDNYTDYRPYLILIALLAASLILCRIFARYPVITLSVSVAPFIQFMNMYLNGRIYDHAMFFAVLVFLPVIGSAADAIYRDNADGKRRFYHAVNMFSLSIPAYCFAVWYRCGKISEMTVEEIAKKGKFDLFISTNFAEITAKFLITVSVFYIVSILLSYILRDVYYIDVMISFVPFVYFVNLWLSDKLYLHPMFILPLVSLCFMARLAVMFSEPVVKRKEKRHKPLFEKRPMKPRKSRTSGI